MKIGITNIISLTEQVGKHILGKLKSGDFTVDSKENKTPVTSLDIYAANTIRDGLMSITPDIPIITEEDKDHNSTVKDKLSQPYKWFIDPIDGTKTALGFAKGKDDHDGWGVHLGLVNENTPERGFVYFPARNGGTLYFTDNDGISYKKVGENNPEKISVKSIPGNGKINASVGWQKFNHPENIAGRDYNPLYSVGGERVCLVAEGSSHIAWLNVPFAAWDIAASHAVLIGANGKIVTTKEGGNDLNYLNEKLALEPAVAGSLDSLKELGFYTKK